MKNLDYPVRIFYSEEDEGYIATVPDLPGCSAFGETRERALKEVGDAIKGWLDACRSTGRKIPLPTAQSRYSGKFLVRLPVSLHRSLAERSDEEGVSLNQYVEYLLAKGTGSTLPEKRTAKKGKVRIGRSRGGHSGYSVRSAKRR